MALSQAQQDQVLRGLMRFASREGITVSNLLKSDLAAAIASTDTWIDSNASSFNSSLPAASQTNLTANQKSLLLAIVMLAGYNTALLKQILGEID